MSRALIAVFDRGDEVSNPLSPLYPLMHAAPPLKEGNPPASECHFSDCALDMGNHIPKRSERSELIMAFPQLIFAKFAPSKKIFSQPQIINRPLTAWPASCKFFP